MYRNTYKERKGRLPPAMAHDETGGEYDLSIYLKSLEDGQKRARACLPAFLLQLVESPGERKSFFFEENGYEYEIWGVYDAKTYVVSTNYVGCPNSDYHHLGQTCVVCGLEG